MSINQYVIACYSLLGRARKGVKRSVVFSLDRRLWRLGYLVNDVRKGWGLLGPDPRAVAFERSVYRQVKEFQAGLRRKSPVGEMMYRRWKLNAWQWFDDLPGHLSFLGLGVTSKRTLRRLGNYKSATLIIDPPQPGKLSRRVALTVVEGCQTFGCQVTGAKDFGHPYHLVNPSILPFAFSLTVFCAIQSVLGLFSHEEFFNMISAICHSYFIALTVAVILT